jgi:hypothetical protein
MLPALLLALAIAQAGNPAPEPPATNPTPPTPPAATTPAPTTIHPAAARRARFVYQLPDGSIWDSFYYLEFRELLADFDALKPKARPTGKLAAWGFESGKRWPAPPNARPSPLWHSQQATKSTAAIPFIYINSSMLSRDESEAGSHFRLGKQVAQTVFEFTYNEYPRVDENAYRLPVHATMGFVRARVEIPRSLPAKPDAPLLGEFILVPIGTRISDAAPTVGVPADQPTHRLYIASTLRMSPADYAAALRDGRAELIEWSFKRNTDRFAAPFTWTRTVIDTASTGQ